MTLEERSSLILAFARVLYVNGQSTDQTVAAAERFGDALGLRAKIMPRWGELQLQAEDGDTILISAAPADPAGVEMDRVASTMRFWSPRGVTSAKWPVQGARFGVGAFTNDGEPPGARQQRHAHGC